MKIEEIPDGYRIVERCGVYRIQYKVFIWWIDYSHYKPYCKEKKLNFDYLDDALRHLEYIINKLNTLKTPWTDVKTKK